MAGALENATVPAAKNSALGPNTALQTALFHYWGYDAFRPLQAEAMRAVVEHRDSVVVLPTGGGQAICFQAPAVTMPGLAVVVSPLISLMKDQVDALVECGIPAAGVNSSMPARELQRVSERVRRRELKLLYVAPERLCTEKMLSFLDDANVSFFAIDEAHCISAWGHDFRPEYRMLKQLRTRFPKVGVHAYTATATQQVRDDIVEQLGLKNVEQLVGSFDRPNLVYRVVRKSDVLKQVRQVIDSHPGESGIVYCISRREVDDISEALSQAGYRVRPYHAGLSDSNRHKHQEEFLNDDIQIVVATVAFGMGIDKSDVRFVIHTGSPKSIEHYQQETGRAGRDGLDAHCWLLWSVANFITWRRMMSDLPGAAFKLADDSLRSMERFCNGVICRHRALVEHFGQSYTVANCGACDVCQDQLELMPDAHVLGQKILSCVVRLKESFGAGYVAQVLTGSQEARIIDSGHHRLSTYGLMQEIPKSHVHDWIEQLAAQGYLQRVAVGSGDFQVLSVTPEGWQVLRGEASPQLLRPAAKTSKGPRGTRTEETSWEGINRPLFEVLRGIRRKLAAERGVPPFIVFGDTTIRDLARRRPSTIDGFRLAPGVGDKKTADYGEIFIEAIRNFCEEQGESFDAEAVSTPSDSERSVTPKRIVSADKKPISALAHKQTAFEMFQQGDTIAAVMSATNRAKSTVSEYLVEFIQHTVLSEPFPWLDAETFRQVADAARGVGLEKLRPLFEALDGTVTYDSLRISVACLRNLPPDETSGIDL